MKNNDRKEEQGDSSSYFSKNTRTMPNIILKAQMNDIKNHGNR